jgi:hypothetical protein
MQREKGGNAGREEAAAPAGDGTGSIIHAFSSASASASPRLIGWSLDSNVVVFVIFASVVTVRPDLVLITFGLPCVWVSAV